MPFRILILSVLAGLGADAGGLEALLSRQVGLYGLTESDLSGRYSGYGFAWVSQRDHSTALAHRQTFFDLPVLQAALRFQDGRPRGLKLDFFARGDTGRVDREFFDAYFRRITARLTDRLGESAELPARKIGGKAIRRQAWVAGPHRLELQWSYEEKPAFRGEFIRLHIGPNDPRTDPFRTAVAREKAPPRVNAIALKNQVIRSPGGNVLIRGLPMVKQRRNYCAVATCERVLRYFGREVDQHVLAQLADADRDIGTLPDDLVNAMRRLGHGLEVQVRVHHLVETRDTLKVVREYNKLAERAGVQRLNEKVAENVVALFQVSDRQLLRTARASRVTERERFEATIKKYLDAGVPVLWTVVLNGTKEESTPDPRITGHMRTLIGYNERSRTLWYSDTWGAGHDRKTLSMDDAWFITTGYLTLEPDGIRL